LSVLLSDITVFLPDFALLALFFFFGCLFGFLIFSVEEIKEFVFSMLLLFGFFLFSLPCVLELLLLRLLLFLRLLFFSLTHVLNFTIVLAVFLAHFAVQLPAFLAKVAIFFSIFPLDLSDFPLNVAVFLPVFSS